MRDERFGRRAARRATGLACGLMAGAGLVAAARAPAPQAQFEMPSAATLAPRGVVTNTGGAPLHVNSVTVGGDAAERYSVVKDTCTGAEVVPYRACVIDIAFLPTAKDDFDAELKLTDNAPDSPQTIKLTGEGVNSAMQPPGSVGR